MSEPTPYLTYNISDMDLLTYPEIVEDMLAVADKVAMGEPLPKYLRDDEGFTYLVFTGQPIPQFDKSSLPSTLFKSYGDQCVIVFFHYSQ